MDADPRQSNSPIPSSVMRPGNMHGPNVYSSACVRCSQQPTGCSPVQVQWAHVPSCRPVGRAMTVTRSRGSWLVDLDHLPARGAVSFLDVFSMISFWGYLTNESKVQRGSHESSFLSPLHAQHGPGCRAACRCV